VQGPGFYSFQKEIRGGKEGNNKKGERGGEGEGKEESRAFHIEQPVQRY
jgi:hypothetical protein